VGKFSSNAYEIELPPNIGISPIFNVADLYPYKGSEADKSIDAPDIGKDQTIQWEKQLTTAEPLQIEKVLDQKVVKKTRDKEYFQYVVKWNDHPLEDATWMIATEI